MSSNGRDQVFISYSHKDKKYLEELHTHLKPYTHGRSISFWDDKRIKTGQKWEEEINSAITTAGAAVLLVSPDFLASEFIQQKELPLLFEAAKKKEIIFICIHVRPSSYQKTKLAPLQAANDPAQPLSTFKKRGDRDSQYVEICKIIEGIINAAPEELQQEGLESLKHREQPDAPQQTTNAPVITKKSLIGLAVHKMADRIIQEEQFNICFNHNLSSKLPQTYLLLGTRSEKPNSLIERFRVKRIQQYVESKVGKSSASVPIWTLGWPYLDDQSLREKWLEHSIFSKIDPDYQNRDQADYSPSAFQSLSSSLKVPAVVIRHAIDGAKLDMSTRGLIQWYIRFWSEIKSDSSVPLYIVFLLVVIPSPDDYIYSSIDDDLPIPVDEQSRSFLSSTRQALRKWRIQWLLRSLSTRPERAVKLAASLKQRPCIRLNKLTCVKQEEVLRWFMEHKIGDSQSYWRDKCRNIFRGDVCKNMADVEYELEGILKEFERSMKLTQPGIAGEVI